MGITQEQILKYTVYSDKTISANEDFRPFIFEQLDLVKEKRDILSSLNKDHTIMGEQKKNLLVDRDNSLIKSNKLVKKIYADLDIDHPEQLSFFLGKTRPSHISKSIDKTVSFIDELLPKIESEGHDELNDFKPKLIEILHEQRDLSKNLYSLDADISLIKAEIDKETDLWSENYSILKDFVKGECKRLKLDYKMFFYDLKHKKRVKHDSPTDSDENIPKEETPKENLE